MMIDIAEVSRRCGVSIKTTRRHVAAGTFPAPMQITSRVHLWESRDVDAFIAKKKYEAEERTAHAALNYRQ